MPKVRKLAQRDWEQLLIVAAGYLPLCNGDLRAAMGRAITAHADLIGAVKDGKVYAHLPDGRITMFVPEDGGVAIKLERLPTMPAPLDTEDEPPTEEHPVVATRDPLDITFQVFEVPSSHTQPDLPPDADAGVHDDGDPWSP
jgi:hypothetical protein